MPLRYIREELRPQYFLDLWELWSENRSRFPSSWMKVNGELINFDSTRYANFYHHGLECVGCGIKGTTFLMEKHRDDEPFHLNLYAIDHDKKKVLMTRDHILPRAMGGSDRIENQQVMCQPCNGKKGHRFDGVLPPGEKMKSKEEIAIDRASPQPIPYRGITFIVEFNEGGKKVKRKIRDENLPGFINSKLKDSNFSVTFIRSGKTTLSQK